MCSTLFMYLEKSSTRPGPIELPAIEVPPPRAVMASEYSRAISSAAMTSLEVWGSTTISGTTRQLEASVEYIERVNDEASTSRCSNSVRPAAMRWTRSTKLGAL